ncbi:MAG TPA: hypothetical protein VMM78_07860 [Thermomicrobiales bacterium]|nr:hypothetical protein [Thermomicrobiales bacterium]
MPSARNSLILGVALLVLGAVLFMIYRSTTDDGELDDEWFDFEHPS